MNIREKFPGIKGAIFDFDGTVLDTMEKWDRAALDYLEKTGIEGDEDLGRELFSLTHRESAEYLIRRYSLDTEADEIMEDINNMMKEYYRTQAEIKPGMDRLLAEMKDSGIVITAATSTDREAFMPALERLDLLKYFSRIYTCTEEGSSKAEPYIFRKAMEFMGTLPEETWLFEDGLYSAVTGKKENMKIAGVWDRTSLHDWDELRKISDVQLCIEDNPDIL